MECQKINIKINDTVVVTNRTKKYYGYIGTVERISPISPTSSYHIGYLEVHFSNNQKGMFCSCELEVFETFIITEDTIANLFDWQNSRLNFVTLAADVELSGLFRYNKHPRNNPFSHHCIELDTEEGIFVIPQHAIKKIEVH